MRQCVSKLQKITGLKKLAYVSDYAIIHFPQISFYRKLWKIPEELTESFQPQQVSFNIKIMGKSGRGIIFFLFFFKGMDSLVLSVQSCGFPSYRRLLNSKSDFLLRPRHPENIQAEEAFFHHDMGKGHRDPNGNGHFM